MTWLRRAPRCPICKRKLADCRRARWEARRTDAGLTVVLASDAPAGTVLPRSTDCVLPPPDPPADLAAS